MNFIDTILQHIENTEHEYISKSELGCISRLVHSSGIREGEITALRVQDVIDTEGNVKSAITTKKIVQDNGDIPLTAEARDAISDYQETMKQKDPSLIMKRRPLFPSYQNERTLRRHLKAAGTNYREIREDGIKHHFAKNAYSDGLVTPIYKEGGEIFRISSREYYAVGSGNKIPFGPEVNDSKQINTLLDLWEQAQRLDVNDPSANSQADEILQQAHAAINNIKNDKTRKSHKSLLNTIIAELYPTQFNA